MAAPFITLDAGDVIKALAKLDSNVAKVVNLRLNRSAIKIRNSAVNRLKQNGSNDTGQLRASIKIDGMTNLTKFERDIYAGADQGIWIEHGRKASGKPAPFAPLVRWAQRKLGNGNLGYAIAKKLATKNLPPKPFLAPSFEEEQKPFFTELVKDIKRVV